MYHLVQDAQVLGSYMCEQEYLGTLCTLLNFSEYKTDLKIFIN